MARVQARMTEPIPSRAEPLAAIEAMNRDPDGGGSWIGRWPDNQHGSPLATVAKCCGGAGHLGKTAAGR